MLQNIKIGTIVANLIDRFLLPPLLRFLENSFPASFSIATAFEVLRKQFSSVFNWIFKRRKHYSGAENPFSSKENCFLPSKLDFRAKNILILALKMNFQTKNTLF